MFFEIRIFFGLNLNGLFGVLPNKFTFLIFHHYIIILILTDKFFITLLTILLPIQSPDDSTPFLSDLFEVVLSTSRADCLPWSRSVWRYFPLRCLFKFYLLNVFSKRRKSLSFHKYSVSRLNWITCHLYMLCIN